MKILYLSDIQQKILQYHPVKLVYAITEQLWRIFLNKEENLERGHRRSNRLIRCSPWICFIAMGNNSGKHHHHPPLSYKEITKETKFKLSQKMWQLIHLKDPMVLNSTPYPLKEHGKSFQISFRNYIESAKLKKSKLELELLELDLKEKTGEYPIAYKVYEYLHYAEDIRRLNLELEIKYSYLPVIRSMLIARQLPDYDKLTLDDISAERFHQVLNLIVKIAVECDGKFTQDKLYGLLHQEYKDSKSEDHLVSLKLDIDKVLEKLLCKDINSSYQKLEENLKKNFLYPTYDLNPLYTTPIISHEMNGIMHYFIPSPYIFIFCTGWLFWTLSKNKIDSNHIGNALNKYILLLLNHYKEYNKIIEIIGLDDNNKESRADFIIKTENYTVIIECKNSLGFRTPFDKNGKDLSSLFNCWNRITRSIKQCNSTKSQLLNQKIFRLVVVNETVLGEAATYIGFYDVNIFNKLELQWGTFSIVSLPQFEYLIANNKLEQFVEECETRSEKVPLDLHYNDIIEALNLLFDIDLSSNPNLSFWKNDMLHHSIDIII